MQLQLLSTTIWLLCIQLKFTVLCLHKQHMSSNSTNKHRLSQDGSSDGSQQRWNISEAYVLTGADPGIRRGFFYHTHFPPLMTHLRADTHSRVKICIADLSSRLEECVSASSACECFWYVASFRKGGSSEPNELPLNPPLAYTCKQHMSHSTAY